jgi:hypothetical protein
MAGRAAALKRRWRRIMALVGATLIGRPAAPEKVAGRNTREMMRIASKIVLACFSGSSMLSQRPLVQIASVFDCRPGAAFWE